MLVNNVYLFSLKHAFFRLVHGDKDHENSDSKKQKLFLFILSLAEVCFILKIQSFDFNDSLWENDLTKTRNLPRLNDILKVQGVDDKGS